MHPDWDKLSKEYADTPNVVIALVDCAGAAKQVCGEQQIKGYPTLKAWKSGKFEEYQSGRDFKAFKQYVEKNLNPRPACSLESKDACSPADRKILEDSEKMTKAERAAKLKEIDASVAEKRKQAKQLEQEAKQLAASVDLIKAGGQKVEKVEQLLNDGDMRAHCETRLCVIAFLPHILDDQSKARNDRLKQLDLAMKATKADGKDVGFLWSQGGDQFEMEEAFGLQFGFPAVIGVNFKKGLFGVHRGTVEKDALTQFILSLGRPGARLGPIPASAKASKADVWDGKDGAAPVEEEL